MFVAIRLARRGYYGGDPEAVLNAPVDVVQNLIGYENFEVEYEAEYMALNRPQGAT